MQNEINGYPLHHVGIIFTDFEKAEAFMKVAGLQEEYRGYVDAYQAWCVFLKGNGASKIELIIPTEGVLTRFNQGKGGLHHIAFSVPDVEEVRRKYQDEGIVLLEEQAVSGAGNILVNFMRPKDGRGVLIEFVETIEHP